MRQSIPMTALLLCLALLCAACGKRLPAEAGAVPAGGAPVAGVIAGEESPGGPEEAGGGNPMVFSEERNNPPEEPGEPPENQGAPEGQDPPDLSGRYTDRQGTAEVYSELTLKRQEDGSYAVSISLYRLALLEGTAFLEEDGALSFVYAEPRVEARITVEGDAAEAEITASDFPELAPGTVCRFSDGKE